MKKYIYHGTSILSFTHGEKDYLVSGPGPHTLPEETAIVKTHLARELLIEAPDSPVEINRMTSPNQTRSRSL